MKRIATWTFYGIGILAILYLGLYAYVMFTGRTITPGDPIHIFRKPDAPELGGLPKQNRREVSLAPDGRQGCVGLSAHRRPVKLA